MTWTTRYVDDDAVPFLVDDGTGRAYVDPDGSDLVLSSGDEIIVEAGDAPPANVSRFLDRETSLGEVASRRRRYREVRLGVGEPVLVAGHADPASDAPGDEAVACTVTADGDASTRFYITDDPSQGVTRRLLQEVFVYLLVALLLFSAAGYLYVT